MSRDIVPGSFFFLEGSRNAIGDDALEVLLYDPGLCLPLAELLEAAGPELLIGDIGQERPDVQAERLIYAALNGSDMILYNFFTEISFERPSRAKSLSVRLIATAGYSSMSVASASSCSGTMLSITKARCSLGGLLALGFTKRA